MDIQDKLKIKYKFRNSVKEIDLNKIKNGETLFEFNEYEPIVILMNSNNIIVEMECLSYIFNNDIYLCDSNVLKLEEGKEYCISSSNNNDEIGYIPSKYQINIIKDNELLNCYFCVKYNSQVQEDGMDNIITLINQYINGLSIDFFKSSPVNNIKNTDNFSKYYIYETLQRYEKKIVMACNSILSSLKLNIETDYKVEYIEKKQNFKTIKKNSIKSMNKELYFNVKKKSSPMIKENILLKMYLMKILNIVKKSFIDLDDELNRKIKKRIHLEKTAAIEREKLNYEISYSSKVSINNYIKSLNSQIDTNEKWINKMILWKRSYNMIDICIKKIIYSDELKELSIMNQNVFSPVFYRNRDYRFFFDLYKLLSSSLSSKRSFNNSDLFADKKSYTLFEIYGFILIQNILKELNFNLQEDFKEDVFSFDSDIIMKYINEEYIVHVYYDHYCSKYYSSGEGNVVSINSRNCKPDYIILIYDKNYNFVDMIIIEMKYRRLIYMVPSENGTTETDDTVTDYSQLAYCVSKTTSDYRKPSKVIVLYPSLDEKIFNRNLGEFIGINAKLDFNESRAYTHLKEVINNAINKS